MVSEPVIQVEVVFASGPRSVQRVMLELAADSTVELALQRSGLLQGMSVQERNGLEIGVWGRKLTSGYALRDRDRIELYRPLRVDPKVARRERFKKQGAKSAGLFAERRQGAKPGY